MVALDGDWRFCWDQRLTPEELGAGGGDCGLIEVPGAWNDAEVAGGRAGRSGVATYQLEILLPPDPPPLTLRIGAPSVAHALWIDGQHRPGGGVIGAGAADTSGYFHNPTHPVRASGEALTLTLQVANFEHRAGGLRRSLTLGTPDQVDAAADRALVREAAAGSAILITGLFFLSFYGVRRQSRSELYFGMAAAVLGLREIPAGYSELAALLVPGMDWALSVRLEYLANSLLVALLPGLILSSFPQVTSRRVVSLIQAAALALAAFTLLAPIRFAVSTLELTEGLSIAALLICAVSLVRAARLGLPTARLALGAACALTIAVAHDVARSQELLHTGVELFPLAGFGFVFVEGYALVRSFSRSYLTIERLSEDLLEKNQELTETNRAVERFVPFDFLRLLNKASIREVERGDHTAAELDILFCDIRSFTPLVESMTPDDAFHFVNAYLRRMEEPIHAAGGFIDKYMGDAIMALFPRGGDAVTAAVGMLQALEAFNGERGEGAAPIRVGIGVNAGPLLLGTIGGDKRMEGGVIGDAVNLAARIEGMTKLYGAALIISEHTLARVPAGGGLVVRELDRVVARGKSEAVDLYEVLDGLAPDERASKLAILDAFAAALARYRRRDFQGALGGFEDCARRCPEDLASRLYVKRCREYLRTGAPEGWRGEAVLTRK